MGPKRSAAWPWRHLISYLVFGLGFNGFHGWWLTDGLIGGLFYPLQSFEATRVKRGEGQGSDWTGMRRNPLPYPTYQPYQYRPYSTHSPTPLH